MDSNRVNKTIAVLKEPASPRVLALVSVTTANRLLSRVSILN